MTAPTQGGPPTGICHVPDETSFSNVAWTADGQHVLAFRTLPSGGEIWSIPVTGGSPEISAIRVHPIEPPAISPDGSHIAFVGSKFRGELWALTGLLQDGN
jgi:hypothetical protein